MKIVVLAGGTSTERDVSLSSGSKIYYALKARGHRAILLDVYLGCPTFWTPWAATWPASLPSAATVPLSPV